MVLVSDATRGRQVQAQNATFSADSGMLLGISAIIVGVALAWLERQER